MSSRPTTIELNGKRYDARTGTPLSAHETVKTEQHSYVKPASKQQGVALDGFARRKSSATVSPAHSVHKKTQKSQTLMRSVVKKPAAANKTVQAKHRAHSPIKHPEVDPHRASRAKAVKKSNLVSRFGAPRGAVQPVASVLPVQPEPAAPPLPVLDHHHKPAVSSAHAKRNFEQALHKAESHKQPHPHRVTRRDRLSRKLRVSTRTVNIAAASMALVLLGGFIAYQNVPNFSMKVATTRAGVEGRLPGYQPNGFSMAGPIKYQPGQITISYASNSDERSFSINQRTSQWNSDTLLENYVATGQKNYQTFQDGGKTIYIYDNNNATWVDGGVWYQIEGNSALNSDQLLRMAASM